MVPPSGSKLHAPHFCAKTNSTEEHGQSLGTVAAHESGVLCTRMNSLALLELVSYIIGNSAARSRVSRYFEADAGSEGGDWTDEQLE